MNASALIQGGALKMGGRPLWQMLVSDMEDTMAALMGCCKYGVSAVPVLQELAASKYGDRFQLLLTALDTNGVTDNPTHLAEEIVAAQADLVVLSLRPYVEATLSIAQCEQGLNDLVRTIKASSYITHVLIFNCSSIDPADNVHTYYGIEDTLCLRIQRLNLTLMKLSAREGISIIDVDRVVGRIGGSRHVPKALQYSRQAYSAVASEFLRVIEDIGFFENRPLVAQAGCDR